MKNWTLKQSEPWWVKWSPPEPWFHSHGVFSEVFLMQLLNDVIINFSHFVKSDYKGGMERENKWRRKWKKRWITFHTNQTRQLNGSTHAQIKIILFIKNLKGENNQSLSTCFFHLCPRAPEFITMATILVAS